MTDLTESMLFTIRAALREYLQETDRYMKGSHTFLPTETDKCCEEHLRQWKEQDKYQRALREKRDKIVAAIRTVDIMISAVVE